MSQNLGLPSGFEDPFQVIGLDIDCDDPAVVQQVVAATKAKWNTAQSKDKTKYSALLAGLRTVEPMLLDPSVRATLCAMVKQTRAAERKERVDAAHRVASAYSNRTSITQSEADFFVRNYKHDLGPTEAELLALLPSVAGAAGGQPVAPSTAKPTSSTTMADIRQKLKTVGRPSLYAVVNLPTPKSPDDADVNLINQRVTEGRAAWAHKTTGEATAMKDLIGYVTTNLIDADKRASYHAAMRLEEQSEITKMIAVYVEDGEMSQEEYRAVLDFASSQGVQTAEAEELIRTAAKKKGAIVNRPDTPPPNQRLCGECGHYSPDGSVACVKCNRPLDMSCPQCATRYPTEKRGCPSCQTTLPDAMRIRDAVEEARKLSSRGQDGEARQLIRETARLFPSAKLVKDLQGELEGAAAEQSKKFDAAKKAVGETRLIAAKTLLDQLGTAPEIAPQVNALRSQVTSALAEVDKLVAQARAQTGDAAAATLARAAQLCSDSTEIAAEGRKYPPAAPTGVSVRQRGETISLEFRPSPSSGVDSYKIVRGVGHAPTSIDDGDQIAVHASAGTMLTAVDIAAPVGKTLVYAVWAIRSGTPSRDSAHAAPIMRTACIGSLVARAEDGVVRLEYRMPAGATGAKIQRTSGSSVVEIAAGPSGAVDTGVVNGTTYSYAVRAVFSGPAGVLLSDAATITATPQRPPDSVRSITVNYTNGVVTATWPSTADRVTVVRSTRALGLTPGSVVSSTELAGFGPALTANSPGTAQDRPDRSGVCHYTAFTVRDGIAVAGASASVACVEDVGDLRAANRTGKVELTWDWPTDAVATVIAWSTAAPPNGSGDASAKKLSIDKQSYQRQGMVQLDGLEYGQYYIRAFAVYQSADGKVEASGTSPGANATAFAGDLPQVTYELKSAGMFKKGHLLVLKSQAGLVLPEIVVLLKPQFVPTDSSDGQTVARIGSVTLTTGTSELPLPELTKGHMMRIFFADRRDNDCMRIVHPPSEKLQVR